METKATAESVLRYVAQKFGTQPDCPFKKDKTLVLRHQTTRKWYAIIMKIKKSHLGEDDNTLCDVMNIKCDKMMLGSVLEQKGFFKAYHMNKQNWVSVILDGSVTLDTLCPLIDISYCLTKKENKK